MMKECGNKLFKEQDYLRAKHKYLKAMRYLNHDGYDTDESCKNLQTTCQLNLWVLKALIDEIIKP